MNSLNILDRLIAERDPDIWTDPVKTSFRALVVAYINGDERDPHLDAIADLVPRRQLVDPEASASVFGTWLLKRWQVSVRRVTKLSVN